VHWAVASQYDVETIALHEIGHLLDSRTPASRAR